MIPKPVVWPPPKRVLSPNTKMTSGVVLYILASLFPNFSPGLAAYTGSMTLRTTCFHEVLSWPRASHEGNQPSAPGKEKNNWFFFKEIYIIGCQLIACNLVMPNSFSHGSRILKRVTGLLHLCISIISRIKCSSCKHSLFFPSQNDESELSHSYIFPKHSRKSFCVYCQETKMNRCRN